MTTQEFSNEFDTILNSYFQSNTFGKTNNTVSIALDEYEKSVFLTKAQEEIVIELYTGKNNTGDSFEKTEEIRRYLDSLVTTYYTENKVDGYLGLIDTSVFFTLPDDLLFITYEKVTLEDGRLNCNTGKDVTVSPTTQDDFKKTYNNPFRRPSYKRVLRLDYNTGISELISDYNIFSYFVRYVKKPSPIILTELPYDLSINNINTITECNLNPLLHRKILDRAIQLAITSFSISNNTNV